MASYFLPSFLTGWDFPSISPYNLSANLQRRILSYILKRLLGHLVKGGQLDLDQIDAGIGSGKIEIRNVQLDADAINAQLPLLPVSFHTGEIGRVCVQLPLPNLWSGELSVMISDARIQLQTRADDWSDIAADNLQETLSSSFASAASELFERDDEGQSLEQSIHESISVDDSAGESHPGSIITSYVEALLARLKVSVNNTRVELLSEHLDFHLVLNKASMHSTTSRSEIDDLRSQSYTDDVPTTSSKQKNLLSETIRTVELDTVEIWMLERIGKSFASSRHSANLAAATTRRNASIHRHGDGDGDDDDDDDDDYASSAASTSSLYQSALQSNDQPFPAVTIDSQQDDVPTLPSYQRIFSTGTEPVKITVSTSKEREAIISSSPPTAAAYRMKRVDSRVDVAIGHLAAMTFVDQLVPVVALWHRITQNSSERVPSISKNKPSQVTSATTGIEFVCNLKNATLILGYDTPIPHQSKDAHAEFWAHPTRSHPHFGHVRLSCDSVSARYAVNQARTSPTDRSDNEFALSVSELRLFEHLSPSLSQNMPTGAQKILPLLIFDQNLIRPQETSSLNQGESVPHLDRPHSSPFVDTLDWRFEPTVNTAPRATASSAELAISPRTTRFHMAEQRHSSPSAPNPYMRTAYGDRGWKLKPRYRSQPRQQIDPDDVDPGCITISCTRLIGSEQGRILVGLAPIHIFLDVSIVTRMLPALKRAAAQLTSVRRESHQRNMSATVASLSASVVTIQASPRISMGDLNSGRQALSQPAYSVELRSKTIRVEIRTPQVSFSDLELSGQDIRHVRTMGLSRRCGLFVLEVCGLNLLMGLKETGRKPRGVHFSGAASYHEQLDDSGLVTGRITVEKVATYMTLFESDAKAIQIATVEAISDVAIPGDVFARPSTRLLPRMIISRRGDPRDQEEQKEQYSGLIPAMNVDLAKQSIDALQYMIDDLNQWSNLWSSEHLGDSQDSVNEGLRILGSRFFGGQSTQSIMSASTESASTARNPTKRSAFAAGITEISVRLQLPQNQEPTLKAAQSLVLLASDMEVLFESDQARNTNLIDARVSTFSLKVTRKGMQSAPTLLVHRTLDASLNSSDQSVLSIQAEAYSEPDTSYREQSLRIAISGLSFSPLFDDSLLLQIRLLLKSPAGVFENVEPNEVTRISVKIRDCTVYAAPPDCEHRAALVLGEISMKTKLTSHAPKTTLKLALANVNLFAIEQEVPNPQMRRGASATVSNHWLGLGFSRVVNVSECKGALHLNSLTRPEVDIKITKLRIKTQVCADTLDVLAGIVNAIASVIGSKKSSGILDSPTMSDSDNNDCISRSRSHSSVSYSSSDSQTATNLMSDIDDEAFILNAPLSSQADFVNDDVPSDPTFLGARGRYHPDLIETSLDDDEFFGGDSVASLSMAAPISNRVVFADEDVTIRLLDSNGINPVDDYFTDPNLQPQNDVMPGSSAISLRIRVANFDFSLRMHSGYDWDSTKKAVEEEAKRVRRRLQKIKQLLAEGQVPDDSVEAATCNLLDSIYISLPQNRADMDPTELMQAMDEELGDFSETSSAASSQGASSTWQSMPAPAMDRTTAPNATSGRRKKLQRSARSVMEFNFSGLELEVDQIDASELSNIAARTMVTAKSFEIIDNVKTSTWHTFLTGMKDPELAFSREDDNRMIKIELLTLRSEAASQQGNAPEYRLRARIAPLRLHVDQDALDFLKTFFAFKVPESNLSEGPKTTKRVAEPDMGTATFIQFAEVLPIKLKLDYKPKRVDYNLLRQGKTIELMNFFHFEGAEMVLRHITLRGITGWARLFDTLNDIWTPDVKANQLADVLSGVAPIRSLVNVGAGLADLVLLPIEQYHKDGRVIRGMQKGATSFAKSTALEAVKLGARLATGTQVILEHAEHILGGQMPESVTARAVGPEGRTDSYASLSESMMLPPQQSSDHVSNDTENRHDMSDESLFQFSRYASQPDDMQEALSQAYSGLSRGLTSAAQTILAIPMEVYEPSANSPSGSARPVVRAVPIAMLRGARGATEAIAKTMQGVQASLGDKKAAQEGKYKQNPRATQSRPG